MSKLSYKEKARTEIAENIVFLTINSSLYTRSIVILHERVAGRDKTIKK